MAQTPLPNACDSQEGHTVVILREFGEHRHSRTLGPSGEYRPVVCFERWDLDSDEEPAPAPPAAAAAAVVGRELRMTSDSCARHVEASEDIELLVKSRKRKNEDLSVEGVISIISLFPSNHFLCRRTSAAFFSCCMLY